MAGHRHFSQKQPAVRKGKSRPHKAHRETQKPRLTKPKNLVKRGNESGSYRDRTDDIHGVNVALYQLS
jgi:hypothetical protein